MIWIRLDADNAEILGADEHPTHGGWIEWGEARRIIREHNEREARREQAPGWFEDVADELRRARAKFPGTDLLTTAFAEEAGELVKAILGGYNGKESDIYTEAIQTIAMVVRLLEEGDPVHRLAPIVDTVTIYKTAAVGPTESFPGFDPTGEGSAWQPPTCQGEAPTKSAGPVDFSTLQFPKIVAWPTEEHPCLTDPPSLPGSGPQLREAVQAIQERAETPPEPAPGSDAEHPPLGYRLARSNDKKRKGYLWFSDAGKWESGFECNFGDLVLNGIIANPIPANEGGGRAEHVEDSRITHARVLADERDRLRAHVFRLQEERDAAVGRAVLAEREAARLRDALVRLCDPQMNSREREAAIEVALVALEAAKEGAKP